MSSVSPGELINRSEDVHISRESTPDPEVNCMREHCTGINPLLRYDLSRESPT